MSDSQASKNKLSAVKQAFLALDAAESELTALKRERSEPIAVVGIGCRLPGKILTVRDFWKNLREGRNAVAEIPKDRWDIADYFDPDPEARGKMCTRWGAFIDSVDRFDADFFGITPREARYMDPQQRILLEVTWEALEDAGHADLEELEGSPTGVFVGVTTDDYGELMMQARGLKGIDTYFASGTARSIVSGRLAYQFGLIGPAVSIDTACSSSLLAVHQACRSLLDKECRTAIAAGVNLMLSPVNTIALSRYQMMAPDGRCKVFDAAADGFVRGEGCAAVILKRLSDAQASRDHIYALILGTAANQDGPSSGLTAPNGPSQVAVMHDALKRARIKPSQVGFVESHGTGTALGDPIEARAIGQCYSAERSIDNPLVIGSVKTNIGHLEAAAGVAGLIKAVLVLYHREIPPNLHFNTPNPEIPWERFPMKVPTRSMPLPQNGENAYAGVSALGFSGTNVHAVLSCAPAIQTEDSSEDRPRHVVTLSAKDPASLRHHVENLANWMDENPATPLRDTAFSLAVGRTHHSHRVAVTGNSPQNVRRKIDIFLSERAESVPAITASARPPVAFLFTGQGAQYTGMGGDLRQCHPQFQEAIKACDEILTPLLGRSIEEVIYPVSGDQEALIHQTQFTQPAMFVLAYALSGLWSSWGIRPDFVLGHSLGEYIAACIAGIVSLEDALNMVVRRARFMQSVSSKGAMAAVMASEAQVAPCISNYPNTVSISAVNGPASVVISGAAEDIEHISKSFQHDGIAVVPLKVSHAFHSPLMEPVLAPFEKSISGIRFNSPTLRFISNVSGAVAAGEEVANPGYWRRHARNPVRFMDGVKTLVDQGCRLFIEIGPKPVLLNMGRRCTAVKGLRWLPSLDRKKKDWNCILDSLTEVYLAGVSVDWKGFDAPFRRQRIPLPTYCFQDRRFWFNDDGATATRWKSQLEPIGISGTHPLLGERIDTASGRILFKSAIGRRRTEFFMEHRISGTSSLPMAAVLEAALATVGSLWPQGSSALLEQVSMDRAIILSKDGGVELEWMLDPCEEGYAFRLYSRTETSSGVADWQEHAFGIIKSIDSQDANRKDRGNAARLETLRRRCPEKMDADRFYDTFSGIGLDFGPAFRTLEAVWSSRGEALGRLCHRPDAPDMNSGFVLSPLALDGALQVVAAAIMEENIDNNSVMRLHLPVGVDRVKLSKVADGPFWAHAVIREKEISTSRTLLCDVRLLDDRFQEIVFLSGCRLLPVTSDVLAASSESSLTKLLYRPSWQLLTEPERPTSNDPVLLEVIGERMKKALPGLAKAQRFKEYERACDDMDRLVGLYITRVMTQLGWHPEPEQLISCDRLAETLRIAERHRQLFKRFLDILTEDGFLESASEDSWRVVRAFPSIDSSATIEALISKSETGEAEFDLIVRCGEKLHDVLQGKSDPLDLLYQEAAFASVIRLYKESVTARVFNGLVKEGLEEALKGVGRNHTLRVLEIGAGTGGTTQYVLEALAERDISYLFTDISPTFVQAAKELHQLRAGFEASVLDIEKDPSAQGLAGRQFDLIIAANVLHATADLSETLRKVHAMTAPGGLLMLLEVTAPQRWIDITFGLTEGWWKFTDYERRTDYPLISSGQWRTLLGEIGFSETLAVPAPDQSTPYERLRMEAVIVARQAIEAPAKTIDVSRQESVSQDWIILAENRDYGSKLCQYANRENIGTTLLGFNQMDPVSSEETENLSSVLRKYSGEETDKENSHCLSIILLYEGGPAPPGADGDSSPMDRQKAILTPLLNLLQTLKNGDNRDYPRLIFVTRNAQSVSDFEPTDPHGTSLWGAVRAVMLEHPEFDCRLIDLDATAGEASLFKACRQNDAENQVALRGPQRYGLRLLPWGKVDDRDNFLDDAPKMLDITVRGSFENLFWRTVEKRLPGNGQVRIHVEAAGLNFRDVLNALGTYAGGTVPFGGECAGTVVEAGASVAGLKPGDRVLAIAPNSFSSEVIADQHMVWRIPDAVNFVQAGSLAIAYTTSAYALRYLAGIGPGHTVLIHAAAGGVGLAAVYLATKAGARIFATAGNPEKRSYLEQLGVSHVMDSRTQDFADQVMAATSGKGVDIVLNCLSGEFIERSLGVTAEGGIFLEIGRSGIMSPEEAGRKRPDVAYHAIDLTEDMNEKPETIRPIFDEILEEITAGDLPLLPVRIFPEDKVVDAFRFMARARHIGKIVLRWPTPDLKGVQVRSGSTYWVTGGLGALGMFTANWLASRGATHLVLTGRNRPVPPVEQEIADICSTGVDVSVITADVSRYSEVERVLHAMRKDCPPLRGIVHAAGVLDDGVLRHQTWERFEAVLRPKLVGAWNLHYATRKIHLDFMILYSSIAGLLGSSGQTNHCAASAFLDSLAHMRRATGLPCLSIDWGAWDQAGAAVDEYVRSRADVKGVQRFSPQTGIQLLEYLLKVDKPQIAALSVDWRKYLKYLYSGGESRPFFQAMTTPESVKIASSVQKKTLSAGLLGQIESAAPNRKLKILTDHVHDETLHILGLDPTDKLDLEAPLHDIGLDSLMAVELRNALSRVVGRTLPTTLLFDYPSISAVTKYLASRLEIGHPSQTGAPIVEEEVHASTEDLLRQIEAMGDDDIDRLLAKKNQG